MALPNMFHLFFLYLICRLLITYVVLLGRDVEEIHPFSLHSLEPME